MISLCKKNRVVDRPDERIKVAGEADRRKAVGDLGRLPARPEDGRDARRGGFLRGVVFEFSTVRLSCGDLDVLLLGRDRSGPAGLQRVDVKIALFDA
jgi:hypothetical protein